MSFENFSKNEIKLPEMQISGKVEHLLYNRVSTKMFARGEFSPEQIGSVLWAAFGKNKKGTRTIPTAMNEQNMKVFVLDKHGVWQYIGESHSLKKISGENALGYVDQQDYVMGGSLHLIYTGSDKDYSPLHAGAAYQNVYLYAEEHGLGTVVRAFIDKDGLKKALHLNSDEFVIIHQLVGYKSEQA